MKINLSEIYAGLDAWRDERRLTAESQKEGYLVNIMEELGELAAALRDYEKIKNGEQIIKKYIASEWSENNAKYALIKHRKVTLSNAEHEIIDALCDIAVFTINTGADLPSEIKPLFLEPKREFSVADIYIAIADFIRNDDNSSAFDYYDFALILNYCASVCESYGYNFEVAMLETIKEISSRTGTYNESAKKWVKDESEQAKSKWYKANYEKARIEK